MKLKLLCALPLLVISGCAYLPDDEIVTTQLDTPESILQTERGLFVTNVINGGSNATTLEPGGYIALINHDISLEPILLPKYLDGVQLYHPKGLVKDTNSDTIFAVDVDQLVKIEHDGSNYHYTSYDLTNVDQSRFDSKGTADLTIIGNTIFIASFNTQTLIKLNKNFKEPATFVTDNAGNDVISNYPTGLVSFNENGTDYIFSGDFPGDSTGRLTRFEVTSNGDFINPYVIANTGNYDGLYVDNDKLYVGFWGNDGSGDSKSGAGVQVYDLTQSNVPLLNTNIQDGPSDVAVVENKLVVSDFLNSVILRSEK
ncbi:hypothetical protein HWV00_14925 [Moritella sp. 24]|uniref:hypothetical protein n=1 Tax=Moritella sp. 24 TaxID=2746230 RepID=UPI001BAC2C06|nr:hypothetical protein [Moritella sp. 24]QUM77405.1 hypothetical protein HWV00_14925 [Moritella sp. 24]